MRLILDSSVLLTQPAILAKSSATTRMLLPQPVVRDIERQVHGTRFTGILNRAVKAGLVEFIPEPDGIQELAAWKRLPFEDAAVLQAVIKDKEKHPDQDVYLVTDDVDLLQYARNTEIRTATSKTVMGLIESAPPAPPASSEQVAAAKPFLTERRNYIIGSFLVGAGVATLLFLVWIFRKEISQGYTYFLNGPYPVWGFPVAAACLGIAFFWFRSRDKISYGTVEVAVGLFGAWRIANPAVYDSAFAYQAATSVYIIVRGLDNIEKGLDGYRIQPLWKRFFGGGG